MGDNLTKLQNSRLKNKHILRTTQEMVNVIFLFRDLYFNNYNQAADNAEQAHSDTSGVAALPLTLNTHE